MDLDWLKYFTAVVDSGSMRQAADRLFVSEAALSKSVAKLEKELGVSLFERKGRGLVLTEAGEHYYHGVSRILEEFYTLGREMKDYTGTSAHGRERIVVEFGGFAVRHLGAFLAIRDERRNLDLQICSSDTTDARSRAFDLALVSLPFDEDRFEGIPLYDIEFGIVTDKGLSLSDDGYIDLQSLRHMTFIMPEGDTETKFGGWPVAKHVEVMCQYAGFTPKVGDWASNVDALVTALYSGRSVAMMPIELYEERFSTSLRLYRISEPKCLRRIWLIWKKGRTLSKAMEEIIEEIRCRVGQENNETRSDGGSMV